MVDQWELLAKRIEEDIAPNTQSLGKLLLDLKDQVDWIRSTLGLYIKGGEKYGKPKAKANSDTMSHVDRPVSDLPKSDWVREEKQS